MKRAGAMIPFSILDLAPVTEGSDAGQAFRHTLDLAQLAERLGYRRYWLAEHHNMHEGIDAFIARHRPDELLLTGNVFDHAARRHSFEIAAAVRDRLAGSNVHAS